MTGSRRCAVAYFGTESDFALMSDIKECARLSAVTRMFARISDGFPSIGKRRSRGLFFGAIIQRAREIANPLRERQPEGRAAQQAAEADGRTRWRNGSWGAGQGSPGWVAHGKLHVGRSLAAIR